MTERHSSLVAAACGEAEILTNLSPSFFPKDAIMFVGNYWGNERGFLNSLLFGCEKGLLQETGFWASMRAYLRACDIDETQCFFTNALMGLTPGTGKIVGKLVGDGPSFRDQCRRFFDEQIRIVQPKAVIVMGNHAREELIGYRPRIDIPHPSSLRVKAVDLTTAASKKVALVKAFLRACDDADRT